MQSYNQIGQSYAKVMTKYCPVMLSIQALGLQSIYLFNPTSHITFSYYYSLKMSQCWVEHMKHGSPGGNTLLPFFTYFQVTSSLLYICFPILLLLLPVCSDCHKTSRHTWPQIQQYFLQYQVFHNLTSAPGYHILSSPLFHIAGRISYFACWDSFEFLINLLNGTIFSFSDWDFLWRSHDNASDLTFLRVLNFSLDICFISCKDIFSFNSSKSVRTVSHQSPGKGFSIWVLRNFDSRDDSLSFKMYCRKRILLVLIMRLMDIVPSSRWRNVIGTDWPVSNIFLYRILFSLDI